MQKHFMGLFGIMAALGSHVPRFKTRSKNYEFPECFRYRKPRDTSDDVARRNFSKWITIRKARKKRERRKDRNLRHASSCNTVIVGRP